MSCINTTPALHQRLKLGPNEDIAKIFIMEASECQDIEVSSEVRGTLKTLTLKWVQVPPPPLIRILSSLHHFCFIVFLDNSPHFIWVSLLNFMVLSINIIILYFPEPKWSITECYRYNVMYALQIQDYIKFSLHELEIFCEKFEEEQSKEEEKIKKR